MSGVFPVLGTGKLHWLFKDPESKPEDVSSFLLCHLIILFQTSYFPPLCLRVLESNLNIQAAGEVHESAGAVTQNTTGWGLEQQKFIFSQFWGLDV